MSPRDGKGAPAHTRAADARARSNSARRDSSLRRRATQPRLQPRVGQRAAHNVPRGRVQPTARVAALFHVVCALHVASLVARSGPSRVWQQRAAGAGRRIRPSRVCAEGADGSAASAPRRLHTRPLSELAPARPRAHRIRAALAGAARATRPSERGAVGSGRYAVDAVALRRTITASLSYSDFRKMLRSYRPTIARAALMKARHAAHRPRRWATVTQRAAAQI